MKIKWKKLREKIPNKIQVKKAVTYEILWTDDFHKQDLYGEMRPDSRQIVLNKNQGDKEVMYTLFHEMIHLFADEYGAKITETDVRKLEKGFYYILKFMKEFNG